MMISIKGQNRTVPNVSVNAIAEQSDLVEVQRVSAGVAFAPEEVNEFVRSKLRMQRNSQEAAF